jgi:uncharacterized protein with FMN-binding domain
MMKPSLSTQSEVLTMKRIFVVIGGTLGGLGAVLAITPPQFATTPTPSAAPTPAPGQSTNNVSGTFTGSAVNVSYGMVQVKITVTNGKITDAQAIQAPNGRSDRWTQMSVPVLRQQTLAAQSAQINGASGASYTSRGWKTSLASALTQAGL